MKTNADCYFAAKPVDQIGESLAHRLSEEVSDESTNVRAEVYATAFEHYYGTSMGRGPTYGIVRGGDQGELSEIRINKAAAILKSFLSLVVGPRVNWRPSAFSGAAGARAATIISLNLLDFYWKRRQLERRYATMAEMGLAFGESFVLPLWDTTIGPIVHIDPTTDMPERGGDIKYRNLLPWDVVRDSGSTAYDDTKWKFIRVWENKWDLVKLYPKDATGRETRSNILAASKDEAMRIASPMGREDSDLVPVWYFFHDPTPSLPHGLEVVFVSGRCVLRFKKLSYGSVDERSCPLVRFAFDEIFGSPHAYSRWWDTLGPQELMDGLETAIATNQLTLATQSVAFEKGTEISDSAITGMKSFVVPAGARLPEGVNLVKTPAEVFEHLKQKASDQQQLLNLNDTFRGQPDTAQMNAQAFMILKASAAEQNSPVQRTALNAVAELGTKTIQIVAERVTDERKVRITGKNQKYLYGQMKYSGGQLKAIEEVHVDIGNPIEQSAAGRYTMATLYQGQKKENGETVSVEELQQVVDTGRIEPVIQSGRDQVNLVESENERLSSGEMVQAHALDNHLMHGRENARPVLNPDGRSDKAVNEAVLDHIHQHYCLLYGLPPQAGLSPYETAMQDPTYFLRIRMLMGQPLPPDMIPMAAPPPGAAPPGAPMDPNAVMQAGPPGPAPVPPLQGQQASPAPTFVQPGGDLPLM